MVSQPPPTEVGLVFESLEASSRVAQLEAEIAQLKDALARRQTDRSGGPAPSHHSERAWSLLVRLYPELPCQDPRHRSGHDQPALQSTSAKQTSKYPRDRDAYARRRTPGRCPSGRAAAHQQKLAVIGLDTPLRVDHDRL